MTHIAPPRPSPGTPRLSQDVVERIVDVLAAWADELRRQDPVPRSRTS